MHIPAQFTAAHVKDQAIFGAVHSTLKYAIADDWSGWVR
jgi:hypothetical protein